MTCANCFHAKIYKEEIRKPNKEKICRVCEGNIREGRETMHYIRCAKGHWFRKVAIFSPMLTKKNHCPDYENMGKEIDSTELVGLSQSDKEEKVKAHTKKDEKLFLLELPKSKADYRFWRNKEGGCR